MDRQHSQENICKTVSTERAIANPEVCSSRSWDFTERADAKINMSTVKTVAVLIEQPERRREIAEALAANNLEICECELADQLYRLAKKSRVDAIIIDQALDGFLSGLDILTRLANDLIRPVTVLVGNLDTADVARAAAIRVSVTMPAHTSASKLVEATRLALSSAVHTRLDIPHAARVLVRDATFIRPMPQLIVRMAHYLNDPDASPKALSKELATDSRMTAEILKVINSTAAGLSRRVTSIQDAVALLGLGRSISLVLSTYVMDAGTRTTRSLPDDLEHRLRLRSVLTASGALTFATQFRKPSAETAYILALLQDLGQLVMAHELGDDYHRILHRVATIPQLQLTVYERNELGFTHADVSAALLQKWELPPVMTRLVLQHHAQQVPDCARLELGWLEAMRAGEALADLKECPTPQRRQLLQKSLAQAGYGSEAELRDFLQGSVRQAIDLATLFNVPVPDSGTLRRLVLEMSEKARQIPLSTTEDSSVPESAAADDAEVSVPDSSLLSAARD